MAKDYSIQVTQHLSKITPSCSVVRLKMTQVYYFENSLDFCVWLSEFRLRQEQMGINSFRIDLVSTPSRVLFWSISFNRPIDMTEKQYKMWFNSLIIK